MKIKLILVTIVAATLYSCSNQKSTKPSSEMESLNTSTMKKVSSSAMDKSQTVTLKKGELFVAVAGFQMKEKETLLQEYFGIIFPPAQKNGFTPLGQLTIDKVAAGDFVANEFVGLFKWPGMESVKAFLGEVSPDELTKLRVKIWSELKQHMIMVSEDLTMTFRENKLYEVKMLWTDQMLNINMVKSAGGNVILNEPVAGYEDLGQNKAPSNILIIEWNDEKTAEKFKNMKMLKSNKEEAFYTHFAFPEEQ